MEKTGYEIQVDVRPTGTESAVVYAPFDEARETLTENGYEIISLPQNAQLRIQQGASHEVSRNGNWTREGIIYAPNGKPKLVRNSPILYSAIEATKAHKNGREFYPTQEQIEQALEDSTNFPTENTEIPTNRFDSEELTVYAFGGEQEAKAYGEFLREAGIKNIPVWVVDKNYVNEQDKPFARQMWFRDLGGGSELDGDGDLHDDDGLRGVKMGAEGTAPQKSGSETGYSERQISKALKDLGIDGLESQILGSLKK